MRKRTKKNTKRLQKPTVLKCPFSRGGWPPIFRRRPSQKRSPEQDFQRKPTKTPLQGARIETFEARTAPVQTQENARNPRKTSPGAQKQDGRRRKKGVENLKKNQKKIFLSLLQKNEDENQKEVK